MDGDKIQNQSDAQSDAEPSISEQLATLGARQVLPAQEFEKPDTPIDFSHIGGKRVM
jgi:hypothetical protein